MTNLNKIYFIFSIFFIVCSVVFSIGCTPNYAYSSVNTSLYFAKAELEIPTCETKILTTESLSATENVTVNGHVITLNNTNITNYVIQNLHNHIFIFESDAMITISQPIHSKYAVLFFAPNTTLYINLNSNIFCGEQTISELSTNCSIVANNLFILGNGSISSTHNCTTANTVNIAGNSVSLQSSNTAVKADNVNILSGTTNIYSNLGINSVYINIYGGETNFFCDSVAQQANYIYVENGILNINSATAIVCDSFIKSSGYLTICADNGIICQSAEILGGHFYAKCLQTCIKSIFSLNISGGTNLIVSTQSNQSAIDAETSDFCIYGGITISNSTYACSPNANALFFCVDHNSLLVLKNQQSQLVYIPQVSGSVMVASTLNYSYYATNGKLIDYENNFYGLLNKAKANTYSIRSINESNYNSGAIIYNGYFNKNGQLL